MQRNDLKPIMDALRRVNHAIHRQFHCIASGSGLKGHQVRYIELLSRQGPMSAKAISETLHIDKGHTSRVLSELTSLRLVCRTGSGRGALVSLTPEGEALSRTLTDNMDYIAGLVADRISDDERDGFLSMMEKLQAVFESQTETPQVLTQSPDQEASKPRTGGIF